MEKILQIKAFFEKKQAVPFMICCRESLKTVSVRRKVMRYEAKDFLATASPDALRKIARARELTREYYFPHMAIRGEDVKFFRNCWEGLGIT